MARAQRKVHRKSAAELLEDQLSEEYEVLPSVKPAKSSDKGERVRVWWEPTRDKERTGFAGAYWPAKVVKKSTKYLTVEYDNGERDRCDPDNIFPHDVPIDFGKEVYDLQVGEFVEVSNNSKTDPCAWLGCVASVGKKFLVDYPFHDSPSEYIRPELLRRARVWDEVDWKYIELGQKWKPGDVASPMELNLLTEDDYFQQLKQAFGSLKSNGKVKAELEAAESQGEAAASSQEGEEQQLEPEKQKVSTKKRSRKPEKPSRAALDEATNGSGDDRKVERPKGAKKRKPSSVRQAHATPASTAQQHTSQPLAVASTTSRRRDAAQEQDNNTVQQQSERMRGGTTWMPKAAGIEVVSIPGRLPQPRIQGSQAEVPAPLPSMQATAGTRDAEKPAAADQGIANLPVVPAVAGAPDIEAAPEAAAGADAIQTATEAADRLLLVSAPDAMTAASAGTSGVPTAIELARGTAAATASAPQAVMTATEAAGAAEPSAAATGSAAPSQSPLAPPPADLSFAQPGTAAAPVSLTDLLQNLQQPVWLMPASEPGGQQQGPLMLLLPKGCSPAGAASLIAVPPPPAALGAGAGAAAEVANLQNQTSNALTAPTTAATPKAAMAASPTAAGAVQTPAAAAAAAFSAAEWEVLQTLSLLDLTSARLALSQRYTSKAYLMLVDCWRQDSPKLHAALRSYKAHVQGRDHPDYEAFMVNIFGMETMQELVLQDV